MRVFLTILTLLSISFSSYAQNIDWQYTYGGSKVDAVSSIISSKEGGYIVCGYSDSQNGDIKKAFAGNDYWVFKINEDGVIVWEYKLGGSSDYDFAVDLHENHKGEIIIIGSSFSNDGQRKAKEIIGGDDLWITSINKDGKLLWSRTYGGSLEDLPLGSIKTKDETYLVTGHTKSKDKNIKKSKGSKTYSS